MMDSTKNKIDPNTAAQEELMKIPGVGPELAQRIIAARPFESVDDLRKVSGIGPTSIQRYLPYLAFSAEKVETQSSEDVVEVTADRLTLIEPRTTEKPSEQTAEEEIKVTGDELVKPPSIIQEDAPPSRQPGQLEKEAQAILELKEPSPAHPTAPGVTTAPVARERWVTRNQAVGIMFLGFVVTLILGLLIGMGVLASINNGQLQFARPSQVNALQAQVDQLESRASVIEQDIQGMRERLDNIEMLGSRVGELEKTAGQLSSDLEKTEVKLRSDVEEITSQVSDLSDEVNGFDARINELQSQGAQFMGFLEGLRALLDNMANLKDGTK